MQLTVIWFSIRQSEHTLGHWYIQTISLLNGKPEAAPLFPLKWGGPLDTDWQTQRLNDIMNSQTREWSYKKERVPSSKGIKDFCSLFSIIRMEVLIILSHGYRKGRYNTIRRPLCAVSIKRISHKPWDGSFPVHCQWLYYITMSSLFPQPLKCVRLSKNCSPVK